MIARPILRGAGGGALVLGAVLLAGCGSSNKALIPSTDAANLQNDFAMIQQFVSTGDCVKTAGWIHQAQLHLAALPAGVDPGLHARLTLGIADLSASALRECAQNAVTTSTTATTTTSSPISSSSATTSASSTLATSSSSIVTTITSSAPPTSTGGNNGGTPPITSSSATAAPAPGPGNGQGNGNGNGQGNGAGGAAAP